MIALVALTRALSLMDEDVSEFDAGNIYPGINLAGLDIWDARKPRFNN